MMDITALYKIYLQHPVISTDSRNCPEGSLFFALRGNAFDGNQFAAKALETASYAVIDDPAMQTSERMILTDNVLKTLQELAILHRKTRGIPVIGITGTNGKTTTKELMASVLSTTFNTLYTSGNLNNHIGVPLTLLRLTSGHEIAVIEMGANHPGEIRELSAIAQPDYGLITNVGNAHLEGFGSFKGVVQTKGELYDYIRHTNGIIFIHNENKYLRPIAGGIHKITYGNNEYDDVSGEIIDCDPFLCFKWKHKEKSFTVNTQLVGDYNLWNILAAITAGVSFNIPAEKINNAISSYKPENNRSQLKKTKRNTLIIDTYNANPSSMKAALDNFALLKATDKMAILGDMLELGTKTTRLHQEVVRQLDKLNMPHVILCGECFNSIKTSFRCFPTVEKLIDYLQQTGYNGYHILIKGSHGIGLEKIIEFL